MGVVIASLVLLVDRHALASMRLEDAQPDDRVPSREGDVVPGPIERDQVLLIQIDAVCERSAPLDARPRRRSRPC